MEPEFNLLPIAKSGGLIPPTIGEFQAWRGRREFFSTKKPE